MTLVRILIWNVADSRTTVAELRERVEPSADARFIWNEAQERFGVIGLGAELAHVDELRELIGKEPDVAEEYDTD